MIIQTLINNNFAHTYSNKGVKIKQIETGIIYDEAVDTLPCRYTYEETDIPNDIEENV